MHKKVRVKYKTRSKDDPLKEVIREEINILVDQKTNVCAAGVEIGLNGFDLSVPGTYLLEDDFGLWYLPIEDCLKMEFLD